LEFKDGRGKVGEKAKKNWGKVVGFVSSGKIGTFQAIIKTFILPAF